MSLLPSLVAFMFVLIFVLFILTHARPASKIESGFNPVARIALAYN